MSDRFQTSLALAKITEIIKEDGPKSVKQLRNILWYDNEMKTRHIRAAVALLIDSGDYRLNDYKQLYRVTAARGRRAV